MKLVKESLYEFTRNSNPLDTLGIGRAIKIREFFRNLNIPDEKYNITKDDIIIFHTSLYLDWAKITELPNNLLIKSTLSLRGCKILIKLPDNLIVDNYLELSGCNKLTELPDDLIVDTNIYVNKNQIELINWIKYSTFASKLRINQN